MKAFYCGFLGGIIFTAIVVSIELWALTPRAQFYQPDSAAIELRSC